MSNPELQANVGVSEKWDARKAGREVAENTLEKLDKDPDFFLLFSTIHYEKHGGFQEFLDGVWDVLPKGTPLIGGTVAGFITPQDCFIHGAAGMAVSYPNMDVAVGYGKNTKRAPVIAAKHCAGMIKEGLEDSKYKNKFLFDMISGTTIPSMPVMGRRAIIRSGLLGKFVTKMFGVSELVFQKGFGREEEILDEISRELGDYPILHGSSLDQTLTTNYQFFNNKVFTNSIVSLGWSSDLEVNLSLACRTGLGKKFKVTSISEDRRIIHKIDDMPASDKLLDLIDWGGKFPTERQFTYEITTYFPVCFIRDDKTFLRPIVSIMGSSLVLMSRFEDDEGYVGIISGKNLIDSLNDVLTGRTKPDFGILSSCAVRLMGMGRNIMTTRDRLVEYFQDKPFVLIYCAGEALRNPNSKINYLNESIASVFVGK